MAGEALAGLREKSWMPFAGVTAAAVVLALLASAGVKVLVRLPEGAKATPALTAEDIANAGGLPLSPDDVTATVTEGGDGAEGAASSGSGAAGGLTAAIHAGRRMSQKDYVESILGRNIFDPTKIGKPECVGDECESGASDLKVTLKGTVVAVPAAYSAAFIAEEGVEIVHAYGIGQKVQGAEILEIQDKRVRVRNASGNEEWLEVGVDKPASAGDGAKPSSGEGGISGDGETNFTIDRSTLDAALGNMDELSGMARALLHRGPDGEYDGYRLSAIRRDTLPDKVGIRNGDIIHSVNGLQINSLDGAMKALDALKTQPNLKVEVTRRGQPTTLNYDIR